MPTPIDLAELFRTAAIQQLAAQNITPQVPWNNLNGRQRQEATRPPEPPTGEWRYTDAGIRDNLAGAAPPPAAPATSDLYHFTLIESKIEISVGIACDYLVSYSSVRQLTDASRILRNNGVDAQTIALLIDYLSPHAAEIPAPPNGIGNARINALTPEQIREAFYGTTNQIRGHTATQIIHDELTEDQVDAWGDPINWTAATFIPYNNDPPPVTNPVAQQPTTEEAPPDRGDGENGRVPELRGTGAGPEQPNGPQAQPMEPTQGVGGVDAVAGNLAWLA